VFALELAEQLGNVAEACLTHRIDRSISIRGGDFLLHGPAGLENTARAQMSPTRDAVFA